MKPFRIGAGNRPDSHGAEKDADSLEFVNIADSTKTLRLRLAGDAIEVVKDPDGSPAIVGTIPGSGSGSAPTGAIGVIGSHGGPALSVGDSIECRVPAGAAFSTWRLDIAPAGTASVAVTKNGSLMGTASVVSAITATGTTSGWVSAAAAQDDLLRFQITALIGTAERISVALYGVRT